MKLFDAVPLLGAGARDTIKTKTDGRHPRVNWDLTWSAALSEAQPANMGPKAGPLARTPQGRNL